MTSPAALRRLARSMLPALPRIGFVLAVTATLATVAFEDGSSAESLSWVSSGYTPAVGDRVLVMPSETGWVVTSQVTPRPPFTASTDVTVVPLIFTQFSRITADGAVVSEGWQAVDPPISGGTIDGGTWAIMTDEIGLAVLQVGTFMTVDLASVVPSGVTVTQVRVSMRQQASDDDAQRSFSGARPVLWLHDMTSSPTSGSPSTVAGPLRGPRFQVGEDVTITLPSTWVTALLSGSATGIGLWSEDFADGFVYTDAQGMTVTVTYTGGDT